MEIRDAALVLRQAAKGDCHSQIALALEILAQSQRADAFTALFLEMQALSYARLAAAHGDPEALNLAAHIGAAMANRSDACEAGLGVQGLRADALAMFDVAADISPSDEALVDRVRELSATTDARTATMAQVHRKFWGHVVSEELGEYS